MLLQCMAGHGNRSCFCSAWQVTENRSCFCIAWQVTENRSCFCIAWQVTENRSCFCIAWQVTENRSCFCIAWQVTDEGKPKSMLRGDEDECYAGSSSAADGNDEWTPLGKLFSVFNCKWQQQRRCIKRTRSSCPNKCP